MRLRVLRPLRRLPSVGDDPSVSGCVRAGRCAIFPWASNLTVARVTVPHTSANRKVAGVAAYSRCSAVSLDDTGLLERALRQSGSALGCAA